MIPWCTIAECLGGVSKQKKTPISFFQILTCWPLFFCDFTLGLLFFMFLTVGQERCRSAAKMATLKETSHNLKQKLRDMQVSLLSWQVL